MKTSDRKRWVRDELIVAFNLYCRTPFGRLHKTNPDIIRLASKLNRTPSSIAMKLVNFASMDPSHKARNVKGLSNASKEDRKIWDEFNSDWEKLAYESQMAVLEINEKEGVPISAPDVSVDYSSIKTEEVRSVKVRLVQSFFRESVLASYGSQCAICQMAIREFLIASHIIPWSKKAERRADPTNGISLCVLHDCAFDRGFIAIDDSFKVLVSRQVKINHPSLLHKIGLVEIEGKNIFLPSRFSPDKAALTYHREIIFRT